MDTRSSQFKVFSSLPGAAEALTWSKATFKPAAPSRGPRLPGAAQAACTPRLLRLPAHRDRLRRVSPLAAQSFSCRPVVLCGEPRMKDTGA
jgi:hypothetical protein